MIAWIVDILLIITFSILFYLSIPINTQKTIEIPKGSIAKIITHLTKTGHNLSIIDSYLMRLIGSPKSGWITMPSTKMNRLDFLIALTNARFAIQKITLIPGETTYIFLQEIAKQLKLDEKKLSSQYDKQATYKEAGIYPDTYHLPHGIKEKKLIEFLVRQSNKKYAKIYHQETNQTLDKHTFNTILTIASIIQKEAANNSEMPIVASVIYNRLAKNMPLQMDGTLNYGKYSHIKITAKRIREDTSPFNTYKNKGFPPYPISSASVTAIRATLHPATTEYLYFVKNKQGVHDFSKTYRTHIRNINKNR